MDKKEILAIFSRISGIPISELSTEKEIASLAGWDSFMWLELALEMEKIGYNDLIEEIDYIKTINDLLLRTEDHG